MEWAGQRIAGRAQRYSERQMAHEVERAEGKADPAVAEADTAVTRSRLEVVAQEVVEVAQHARAAGRVQAMATIVDGDAGDVERPGESADCGVLIDDGDLGDAAAGQLEGCT
jgi:hypothetical protein